MNDELHRRGLLAWAGLVTLGSAPAAFAADAPDPPTPDELAVDAPLGRTLDGKLLRLSDFDGKPVIVFFWASWCPYCRNELPVLERLQAATGERLRVIAINVEERDVYKKLVRVLGDATKLVHTYDPGEVSAKAFAKPRSLPYTMLVRADRSVASTQRGWGDRSVEHLVKQVNAVLAAAPQPDS